ncbi:GntR family transcriptional regulator [Membranihabitans marinus]|uniref:GntR family transcriptional regulator n=1 Tax=Membranihabitans marinus TaxID=1227546 RepID=UPI001F0093C8|nr:GntR family transcriptional regulator [Membranihabitans marinus]
MLYLIKIDNYSSTPKYQQIFNCIAKGIEDGNIESGEKLPSIPEICSANDIAKKTVEKAYNLLKSKGIIEAIQGKGHYVKATEYKQKRRIFLLFNKLSRHKKIIYDNFVQTLGEDAAVDFYVYHNEFSIFNDLLTKPHHNAVYSHYVIISHFLSSAHKAKDIINQLPKQKLLILDKLVPGISGDFSAVYQNFEKNIFDALKKLEDRLKKYTKINLIFPFDTYQPRDIIWGFQKFCIESNISYHVINDITQEEIHQHEAYITLMDDDLVTLIKKFKNKGYKVGDDVGVISYNENPLKELLLDGITVISTDFEQMGKSAAKQILENTAYHIENPFKVIIRNSL